MKIHAFALAIIAVGTATTAFAQDGVSTASAARTKYLGNRGEFPSSREIAVEDFVNYPRHELPLPKAGQAVAMDVRWGNDTIRDGRPSTLQIGFSTELAHDREHLRPLNLAIVIDKSGSMADFNKLERVKQALLVLVSKLRDTDTLSLVTFDANARVVFPAQRLANRSEVTEIIRSLRPGSSTNLEAGLMLGYKEAEKVFDRESTNRVILLTDGIANQGVISPMQIERESQSFNEQGIDLSTIGVGEDLNKDLLRDLAKSGRGLFHFIADDEDVQKVFASELQSLISPVAKNPELEVTFGSGLRLEHVYGFEPRIGKNSVRIHLDTMNSGMTEVVILRFEPLLGEDSGASFPVKVHLTYQDIDRGEPVSLDERTALRIGEGGRATDLEDDSVAKNCTIADLAQSIKDMAVAYEAKDIRHAEALVANSVTRTMRRYPNLEDADIKRTFDMAVKYRDLLQTQISPEDRAQGEDIGSSSDVPIRMTQLKSLNLVPNGDFTQGNSGFSSDREYISPTQNCLWGGRYTVASAFNFPAQLHVSAAAQPFSAPGGGQVLFMNTGGSEQFVVWSTRVHCKPHTKYRISFQEIGLSGGREWINSYEIRLDKDRSEPQLGGDGSYVKISYDWDSDISTSATLSIVRLPKAHDGGVIGIANIEMHPSF